MMDKLLIGVLGNEHSGKSHTWDLLFGHEVRTGKNLRRLYFDDQVYTEVFLVNRSPARLHRTPAQVLRGRTPAIVLASLEYRQGVEKTLRFFASQEYFMYIQWLNPGYSDEDEATLFHDPGVLSQVFSDCSMVGIRNGKEDANFRVGEIRDYIYTWAHSRRLLMKRGRPYINE